MYKRTSALNIKAVSNYRDATTSEWKLILDQWIAKDRAKGRRAILTTNPEDCKHEKNTLIPKFWREALIYTGTTRKLKLELVEEVIITTETARAERIWEGHIIKAPLARQKQKHVWMDRLHLNRVGDANMRPNGNLLWTIQ